MGTTAAPDAAATLFAFAPAPDAAAVPAAEAFLASGVRGTAGRSVDATVAAAAAAVAPLTLDRDCATALMLL